MVTISNYNIPTEEEIKNVIDEYSEVRKEIHSRNIRYSPPEYVEVEYLPKFEWIVFSYETNESNFPLICSVTTSTYTLSGCNVEDVAKAVQREIRIKSTEKIEELTEDNVACQIKHYGKTTKK